MIIPARYDSHRFPGKVLVELKGKEILAWVYESACSSKAKEVCITTDDERVAALGQKLHAKVIMTSPKHSSGTSRIEEATRKLGLKEDDIVVNVQGDEPLMHPANIDQLAKILKDKPFYDMASLTAPITNTKELHNINCVKAIADKEGKALYFSRNVIPWARDDEEDLPGIWQRHLGIYSYRVGFLAKYVKWDECSYERTEKLEQLRALYNGANIALSVADKVPPPGIDTPEDLRNLENLIK